MKLPSLLVCPILLGQILIGAVFSAQVAEAACVAPNSSSFTSAASIAGNQVALCAAVSQTKTSGSTTNTSTTKAPPKSGASAKTNPVAKVVSNCPASVTTTAQIVAATLAGCKISGPSSPPAPIAKPKPITTVVKKSITSVAVDNQTDQAVLSPRPLAIAASSSRAKTGEAIIFSSDANEHERSAQILGRTGYVRFVPLSFDWSKMPGQSGAVAVAAFSTVGPQKVELWVTYLASARFSLSAAWMPVGEVTVSAETEVQITEASMPRITDPLTREKPRLVSASCQKRPSNYRC